MLIAVLALQVVTLAAVWYAYTKLCWRFRRMEKWAQIIQADVVDGNEHAQRTARTWVEAID